MICSRSQHDRPPTPKLLREGRGSYGAPLPSAGILESTVDWGPFYGLPRPNVLAWSSFVVLSRWIEIEQSS